MSEAKVEDITEKVVETAPIAEEPKEAKKPTVELDEEGQRKYQVMRSIGEECIQDEELKALIKSGKQFIAYDGFEPSGRVHIAQGILKSINVNKITSSGGKFIFLVADWFALMNNKMGGDLKKIQTVGKYMVEVWKSAGMNLENVEFVQSSDIINAKSNEYWTLVLDIARRNNLDRIVRCSQIMGRDDTSQLSAAQIFYPCMQCADIFFLKADICQLGVDQRKVNMLAREYCDMTKRKFKPVILSHHMLMGLTGEKMSKSDPMAAIFMEDTEADVNTKIKKAYCLPGDVTKNPCLEYVKYIVLEKLGEFLVERNEANGGNKLYTKYEDIEADFAAEKLHPVDLKTALIKALNKILQPVRDHFKSGEPAVLLKQVKSYKVTK